MKIKTRKQLLDEYHQAYPEIITDPEQRIISYFEKNNLDLNKALKKAHEKASSIAANRQYRIIRIVLYEYPMKTDRPRHTQYGRTYSPNAKMNNSYLEKAINKICSDMKLIHTPATIEIDAYLEMPASVKPDEVILYEAKILDVEDTPDYDNIGKCYTDMLKNNIVLDDDIFHTGIVRKYYSLLPRVEMRITYLADHESDYVFKKLKNRKSVKEAIRQGLITFTRMSG